ncbi:MAG: DUF1552 domain-containing protein [Planctomycetaceae bacterium]|nr:DUF1552 domain-containing protein [Planctomycetaceae bacterium]
MLRGLGTAVSLPLLDVMESPAAASESASKKTTRLAYLYIPNGVANGAWLPEEAGADGQLQKLNPWMKSLQPFASELTLFKNIWTPEGNGHSAGTATWLTGGGFNQENINVGGPSADQIAAKHFRSTTLLPSLEMAMRGEGYFSSSLSRNSISWADAQTPVPREIEPRAIFDRMFRAGESQIAQRSVLDMVIADARRMKNSASIQDRQKIDEYLESIRSIERKIAFAERQKQRSDLASGIGKAMIRPAAEIPENHGEYVRVMLDMIVLAFWADATRVATCMMDHGQSNRYFNFIDGVTGTWHALSHWKDISGKTEDDDGVTSWKSREEKRDMYNRVTAWHTEQVAYLVGRLNKIREGDGTLLDHSTIVYGSSLSDGHEHQEKNLPLLLAGRGGGAIRPGRLIGGRRDMSMSDLHLSLLQATGVPLNRFANSDSPLPLT